MCEAIKHDIATVEALAKVMHEQCPYESNGRCSYHEDLVKAISMVKGRVDVVLVIQLIVFGLVTFHMGWR